MKADPGFYDYWPYENRPRIEWPGGARVAFWVAPNIEYYELDPPANPYRKAWPQPYPALPGYSIRDYGNRVGHVRQMEVLDRYGVRVIALSKDDQATAQAHRTRDDLHFDLLTDPNLIIIKQFGLLHEGAIEFRTWFLAGHFPMGYPTGFKQMAIPTTLILDEEGVVRWIDQADDYRIRGDQARTEQALVEVFGTA